MIDIGEGWLSSDNSDSSRPCGVFIADKPEGSPAAAISLRRRDVAATVYCSESFAEVTETLSYVADEDCTVHFVFPLPPRAAVFRFKAVIGDREVVTEVKRKAEAQAEYKQAVSQGHSAVLIKQAPSTSLFTVDLGNLAAMEEAVITFVYVRVLDTVAGALEFVHTATWVPPYIGGRDLATHSKQEIAEDHPTFTGKASYGLSYNITLLSDGVPVTVDSPSPIVVSEGADGTHKSKVVTLAESVSDPSRDLSLLIELPKGDAAAGSRLTMQECQRSGKTKTVGLASFMPSLPEAAVSMKEGEGAGAAGKGHELIFVVDGSGSMDGAPIKQALQAALFFVKDLPTSANITFNACMFGSNYQMMWPASRSYDSISEKDAISWLQSNVHANWGGTEILCVLQNIYNTPITAESTRQIIFLTDGGVSSYEEQHILSLINIKPKASIPGLGKAGSSSTAALTTVFCLGIGHGVHRGLVEAMAKQSGGVCAFVVDEESIATKCAFLKKCALATGSGSCLMQPRVVARSALVRVAPHVLPARVFPGEPLQVLIEVLKAEPGATLDLVGQLPDGSTHTAASLKLDGAQRTSGDAFAVLHAMALVGGLLAGQSALHVGQDGTPLEEQPKEDEVVDAIVAAAVSEHLVTPHTSAVGVLLRHDPLDPSAVKRVEVPLELPAGRTLWQQQQQHQQQQACAFGGAPMLCMSAGPTLGAAPMMCMAAAPAFGGSPAPGGAARKMMKRTQLRELCSESAAAPAGFLSSLRGKVTRSAKPQAADLLSRGAAPPPPAPAAACCSQHTGFGSAASPVAMLSSPSSGVFGAATFTPFGVSAGAQSIQFSAVAPPSGMFGSTMNAGAAAAGTGSSEGGFGTTPATNFDNAAAGPSSAASSFYSMAACGFGGGGSPGVLTVAPCAPPPYAPADGGFADPAVCYLAPPPYAPADGGFADPAVCYLAPPGTRAEDEADCEDGSDDTDMLCADDAEELPKHSAAAAAAAAEPMAAGAAPAAPATLQDALPRLNLSRSVDGAWHTLSPDLLEVLAAGGADTAAMLAGKPAGMEEAVWATVLVLAFLRKRLGSERGVWQDMEAKALGWLAGCWPEGCGYKSVGAAVLGAMKLV